MIQRENFINKVTSKKFSTNACKKCFSEKMSSNETLWLQFEDTVKTVIILLLGTFPCFAWRAIKPLLSPPLDLEKKNMKRNAFFLSLPVA